MPTDELAKPEYLGDGLYAEYDGHQIRLFASDGETTTDEVFLDLSVQLAFIRYIESIRSRS
jgi:hypothetical protein